MQLFKNLIKNMPTLLTAVLLAVAVWILAVTNIDPVERRTMGAGAAQSAAEAFDRTRRPPAENHR